MARWTRQETGNFGGGFGGEELGLQGEVRDGICHVISFPTPVRSQIFIIFSLDFFLAKSFWDSAWDSDNEMLGDSNSNDDEPS